MTSLLMRMKWQLMSPGEGAESISPRTNATGLQIAAADEHTLVTITVAYLHTQWRIQPGTARTSPSLAAGISVLVFVSCSPKSFIAMSCKSD